MGRQDAAVATTAELGDAAQGGDRRSVERQRVLRKGMIQFIGSDAAIDCVILDISPKGARLRPIDVPSCPNDFMLMCPNEVQKRCRVVWRDGNQIGVKFD